MFSISEAAKYNLEAIVHEFQRASQWYGPLYHERLVPWSGMAPAAVSDDEWDKFIELESDKLPDDEWWEWEGASTRSPGWNASFLERWFGDPEGRDSFLHLVESTLAVLDGEDLSEIDIHDVVPFDFRSAEGWVGTLHAWAFRYQMPLLRSTMTTWGREGHDRNEFFDTVNLWRQLDGGARYPAHPIRWALIDDVFTSSMAAIRALLRPDLVITDNEPWPLIEFEPEAQDAGESDAAEAEETSAFDDPKIHSDTKADIVPDETCDVAIDGSAKELREEVAARTDHEKEEAQGLDAEFKSAHRIIHGPFGYEVHFSGDEQPVLSTQQTGLIRIAKLIETDGKSWEPDELAQHRRGRTKRMGRAATRENNLEDTHGRSKHRSGIAGRDQKYNAEAIKERKNLKQELKDWNSTLKDAISRNCQIEVDEANEQMARIRSILNLSMASDQFGKAKDTVSKTIRQAIIDLQTLKPKMRGELELLLRQIDLTSPEVRFVSLPHFTKWVVERLL